MSEEWKIKGELILSCSCTVFCPCVISLGNHPPTEGYCQGWAGVHIDEGYFGDARLDGLNFGILLDIPGEMGRGNWTAAGYIDERADDAAYEGLAKIISGNARGTTGLFKLLVSNFLGIKKVPIKFEKQENGRLFEIPKTITGFVEPVRGADPEKDLVITNTEYWMGADVTVSKATKSKVRDYGRVWNFDGRSAEYCAIEWSGP
jgi:hypothetical protein